MAFDSELFVKRFFQIFPYFQIFRPLPRQHDTTALALRGVEVDVDIVAHFDLDVALTVGEFLDGNLSFGFVADVDQHMSRRNADDSAFNDPAGLDGTQALLEHRFKFAGAVCRSALFLFILFCHANQLRSV